VLSNQRRLYVYIQYTLTKNITNVDVRTFTVSQMPEYKIHRRSDVDVSALQPTTVGSTQSLPRPLSRRHRPRSTLSVAHRGGDSEDGRGQGGSSGVDYPELRPRHRSTAGSEPNSPKTNQGFSRLSSLPKKGRPIKLFSKRLIEIGKNFVDA
jgi:hypothetical protein